MNKKLKQYLDNVILTKYKNNLGGHGVEHIEYVINRSIEIVNEFNLDVDMDMVYTIAMFHDIGYKINPKEHNIVSANIFMKDEVVKSYFSEENIKIIYEAIVDHRASLEYNPRSIYGEIVSTADREIDVDRLLVRSIKFGFDKLGNVDILNIINDSYNKISKKYGVGGYAKIFYKDKLYREFEKKIKFLCKNKEEFIKYELDLVKRHNLTMVDNDYKI